MYVATPAKRSGESAAAARSWGQRRGVAALGWVRNTRLGAGTGLGAPKTTTGCQHGRPRHCLLEKKILACGMRRSSEQGT